MSEEQVVGSPEVVVGSPERDIHVKAIVKLEKVDHGSSNEDNETELYKMRAKVYRYHVDKEDGSMWKERGVGDVKILKNEDSGAYRVLMRRDKTLKICLNHYLISNMEIKAHGTNEKALLWSTPSDFADGESKPETLCIRFGKAESATEFKSKFEECVKNVDTDGVITNGGAESDKLADDLSGLKVKEEKDSNDNTSEVDKNKGSDTNDTADEKSEK